MTVDEKTPDPDAGPAIFVANDGPVTIITINRYRVRNALDTRSARNLYYAFRAFERDAKALVAVIAGEGGTFCSGADMNAVARGEFTIPAATGFDGMGSMGPTRLRLVKPVIAAIEGYAVAGGLELALWADLRVAAEDATFGVLGRKIGAPLMDLGTIRLPRLIGHGRALDLILTGREVSAQEAFSIGLVNRLVPHGEALEQARALAHTLASFPQNCLQNDRLSVLEQWDLDEEDALEREIARSRDTVTLGEAVKGARQFIAEKRKNHG